MKEKTSGGKKKQEETRSDTKSGGGEVGDEEKTGGYNRPEEKLQEGKDIRIKEGKSLQEDCQLGEKRCQKFLYRRGKKKYGLNTVVIR